MIGRNGERGSGISALAARHDDDDDEGSIYGSNKGKVKLSPFSRRRPEGSLFNSYYSKV